MDLSIIYRLCVMMLDIKQTIKDRDHDLIANIDYTGLYLLLTITLGKDMYYYRHKHSYTNRPKILFRSKDYTKERKTNTIHFLKRKKKGKKEYPTLKKEKPRKNYCKKKEVD